MITEETLQAMESELDAGRYQWHGEMRELIAEVRRQNILEERLKSLRSEFDATIENLVRTRREADWLADQLEHTSEYCIKTQSDSDHCDKWFDNGECTKCWRQAAMDAFEDGSHA